MQKKVVFLFRPGKRARRSFYQHTFTFNPSPQPPLLERLFHPFTKYAQGLDWGSAQLNRVIYRMGSAAVMRSLMLAQIVARQAPSRYAVSSTTDPAIKDSVVVLNKQFMNKEPLLKQLKRNGNIIFIDFIDGIFDTALMPYIDGILCCSHRGFAHYSALPGAAPAFFVEHSLDVRLPPIHCQTGAFSPWYFGAPENFLAYESIRDAISIYITGDRLVLADWVTHLEKANFHYAVRPPMDSFVFKPFLKGFVAAWCGANILVHKGDGDAVTYLGEDYPYLIREEINEAVLQHYMAKAKEDFGGTDWNYGLSIMRDVRERVNETTIARQFWKAITAVG